ncbi:MAG TPA: lysophospholipid acyltransferase family protein [Balneolaceae bacterium]|nr:lysophospholipid acyltransferase family protein [Balneolaceae bacterium]
MRQKLFSVLIWTGIALLVIAWLPAMALVRLFDRDPVRYSTGRLFRRLGSAISRINPNWKITIEGEEEINDRNPYIIVCNHLSNADIPLISNLPWEMKWVAKKELFDLPVLGWMMKMAQDISVDRSASNKRIGVFKMCSFYLKNNCSVMFFPEGTRSRDGRMKRFSLGAFDLAIKKNIPILPLVIDGTQDCLPKKNWVFTTEAYVNLKVLTPIPTERLEGDDSMELMKRVRGEMLAQLSEWRNQPETTIDATTG